MKTRTGLLIVVLVAVSGIGGYLLGQDANQMPEGAPTMHQSTNMHEEMASMMSGLEGKEGDALDEAFLTEMTTHHEGAVTMAQAVLAKGAHPELKQLAEAIVGAQTKEIAQMKAWKKSWYGK